MEWPKRARTADWENGVLALDREKQFEVPKLTAEIMERLAGYTLVGFHVKGYPVTDELLAPFAGHKSMANFGVENGALTDACFPVFSAMPKQHRSSLLICVCLVRLSGLRAKKNFSPQREKLIAQKKETTKPRQNRTRTACSVSGSGRCTAWCFSFS